MIDHYQTGIDTIVTDYAKKYLDNPQAMKDFFCKYQSPVSIMNEFYRRMVATKEMEPIEDSPDKQRYWDEVCKLDCDRNKRIAIAKALYSLDKILK